MIVASFLHKLAPYLSFGQWLTTSYLKWSLPPSDSDLRPYITTTSSSTGNRGSRKNKSSVDLSKHLLEPNLAIPKSANLKLQQLPIKPTDLLYKYYTNELQWMIDFMLAAISVFVTTMFYYTLKPEAIATELNLSSIWLVLAGGYVIAELATLTSIYLSEELSSQRSVCIVFTMLFFVCALAILLIDEGLLDFGLERTHKDIGKTFKNILEVWLDNPEKFRMFPMWMFKIGLAVISSLLSLLLIYPGFRFTHTHLSALRYTQSRPLKMLLHLCYISPMFCLSLWIRPLSKDMIEEDSISVFGLVEVTFEEFRYYILVGVCLLRLILFKKYVQTYLDSAKWNAEKLRREQGRITIGDLRTRITNIFDFYPAMCVQYIAPFLILLALSLLLHSSALVLANPAETVRISENFIFRFSGFDIGMFYGCISFLCWWTCFTITITTGFGYLLGEYLL